MRILVLPIATFFSLGLALSPASAADLEQALGRSETRVRSAPYRLAPGLTVERSGLLDRLQHLGYERVRERPAAPGRFFYGHQTFWIFRRAHRTGGRSYPDELFALSLRRKDGMILGGLDATGEPLSLEGDEARWLEPEALAESIDEARADRFSVLLDDLPSHVWQALLAAEDARFFDHMGVDARSVARAALANAKAGGVAQGGSTITQQLIKNRDLTPKRSMSRKVSEAVRALMLEAEYDKREILQAYLNRVYYGHVDGLSVHGIGAAARVYFSTSAAELSLAQSALLAAVIQGPNRLSPSRHPERARERRDWVLGRMEELGWGDPAAVGRARSASLGLDPSTPVTSAPVAFVSWASEVTLAEAARRIERGRGVVVETTLDPELQRRAEAAVAANLKRLRRDHGSLRKASLSATLVALDVVTGDVLAHVGGDPAAGREGFDRVRDARRQPGSTVKPFVMLEALGSCGERQPLHVATRIADEPLRVPLDVGSWEPQNYDGRFRGVVDLRTALADSRNVPVVRVARWCGLGATARKFERVGLDLPETLPPSFVLGSIETTPLDLARAYTVFATPGRIVEPRPVSRIERPGGGLIEKIRPRRRKVVQPATAYLVRDLMRTAVRSGTARGVRIDGVDVAAKTGSTSDLRDAWLAGQAGSIVTVVWVGRDDGGRLGLTGAQAAAPIWRDFMQAAVGTRPPFEVEQPKGLVRARVDPQTGLRVGPSRRQGTDELFRRGVLPPKSSLWRLGRSAPVVR